jgi:23S rRNA (guanosine2251-2'-O)-methyltransferase
MRIIYGINPIIEILSGKNSGDLKKIIIAKGRGGQDIQKILDLAKYTGGMVEFKAREEIDALAGGKSQGIVGFCKPFQYADLQDVITNKDNRARFGLILILDSITDPQNLGSLIRTAYFFGANGVIIPENRAASVNPTVLKASSGAANHLPVAMVTNLARAIDELKEAGYWIYGTDAHAEKSISDTDFNTDTGIVMGSEGSGLRPLVRKKCDLMVSIPGTGNIDSLNVSVSAGILIYGINEKRKKS